MFFSSFKTNKEIYQPAQLLPEKFDGQAYGMLMNGQFVDFGRGYGNPFSLPVVNLSSQLWFRLWLGLFWQNILSVEKLF